MPRKTIVSLMKLYLHIFTIVVVLVSCTISPTVPSEGENPSQMEARFSSSGDLHKDLSKLLSTYQKKSKLTSLSQDENDLLNNIDQLVKCPDLSNECLDNLINGIEIIHADNNTLDDELSTSSAVNPRSNQRMIEDEDLDPFLSATHLKKVFKDSVLPMPSDRVLEERMASLDKLTPFNLPFNQYVKDHIAFYLQKKPYIIPGILGRSKRYFPMIEQILDKYNLPIELKYLAVVESALIPYAGSRVGAKGLWQFMYWTGKQNGLAIESLIDERFDPVQSTEAACKYLTTLYKMFDENWYLALAAYNSGPGNVRKAIRRSGGYTNFWRIRPYLPRETRGYVPGFIAANYILHFYKEHDIPMAYPGLTYFDLDTIYINRKVTFDDLSGYLSISREKLEDFNPHFTKGIIPGNALPQGHILHLPKDKEIFLSLNKDKFYAKIDSINKTRKIIIPKRTKHDNRVYYRVRYGDVLGTIAEKFGVRVSSIKRWNRIRGTRIRVGQRLRIYPRKNKHLAYASNRNTKRRKKNNTKPLTNYSFYEIKKGETLWEIAKKFRGVSANQLMYWNKIRRSRDLKPGMSIKVPKV